MRRGHVALQRQTGDSYPSLASFYNADPDRINSRELDIGLWWREDADGPLYRAAWVCDTGELYLVRLGPREHGGGHVEVLATVAERRRLECELAGWRERCGEPRSLTWLRTRAERLDGRARSAHARMASTATRVAAVSAMTLVGV